MVLPHEAEYPAAAYLDPVPDPELSPVLPVSLALKW
jgi:hypothetical protein